MTAPQPSGPVPRDGRRARRHRSRDLAVDALLELLEEGVPRPTAQQVAERSGVSLRSIFRIFDDVESLHSAAASRQVERVRHLYVDVDADGTSAERLERVVRFHDGLYEQVAPVRRAAHRGAGGSEVMRAQLVRVRSWLVDELDRVFAPELHDADPSRRSALELVLSFEAWDQLATGQGLAAPERIAVTTQAAAAVLGVPQAAHFH